MSTQYDVIIIGGGASGMMAAAAAGNRGLRVLLLEKNNRLGAKLSITGGGRCNITNAEFDIHTLLAHYGSARDFLYSPFAQFGVTETIVWFESRGLPVVVEARKRAFPASNRASDVVAVLEKELKSCPNITITTGVRVQNIIREGRRITSVSTDRGEFMGNAVVLATGGMSHPETGSTGDGFEFLRSIGHTVVAPTPTIVPIAVSESWIRGFQGLSLPDAKITVYCDSTKKFTKRGPILFTHFGLSGPTILNSAGAIADLLHAGTVTVAIDMYPDMDQGTCEQYILSVFDENKNKTFKNIIRDILRVGSADIWLPVFEAHGISTEIFETKVHSISRDDRKKLVKLAKAFPFTVSRLMGFDRAVVADGGVTLSEIDTKTMQSKLFDNLYITGDLLHINRPSGGYSLQLCWTSGYVAGNSV